MYKRYTGMIMYNGGFAKFSIKNRRDCTLRYKGKLYILDVRPLEVGISIIEFLKQRGL